MAGTVVQTKNDYGLENNMREIVCTCVADAAAATVPDTALTEDMSGWWLERIVVNPGTTAPTVNSDITLEDADGVDVLGGAGTNLIHNTASTHAFPLNATVPVRVPITGTLTQTIANNAVNSANIVIKYIFTKYKW